MTTLSEHLSRLGKKGGKARAQNLSEEERKQSARKAAEARWAKEKEKLNSTQECLEQLNERSRTRRAAKQRKAPAK